MAVFRPGSIVVDIRGSVGEETYTRGLGGLVVKRKAYPTQTASTKRDQIQANFKAVQQGWSGRLTADQRQAWHGYGRRYPRPNRWGESTIDSGYLAFVRCNCSLKLIDDTWWIDDPPKLGMLPIPAITITAYFTTINVVSITIDPAYQLADDYYLIISAGQTTNSGVSYYSSPWQLVQASRWFGSVWTPLLIDINMPVWTGTKTRFWAKAFMLDKTTGRLSIPFQNSCIIT